MNKIHVLIKKTFLALTVILISMQILTVSASPSDNNLANISTAGEVEAYNSRESFSDVKSTDWFYNDVLEARRLGLISGVGNNKFAPSKTVTYSEFIAVLTRVLGVDVSKYPSGNHWASQNIEAAQELGIINGLEKSEIDSAIPRQNMVVFSCKALGIKPIENENEYIFADSKGKDKEETAYINAAYKEYLTDGIEKNADGVLLFGYDKPVTRAQLATMALRIKAYKDNSEQYKKEREKIRKLETDLNLNGLNNVAGNTGGNIANGGEVALQGDWIFYRLDSENEKAFYKIRTDGSNKTKLSDDFPYDINVIGDWLYYASEDHIYKMHTDGSDKTQLLEISWVRFLNVVGDWMYFTHHYGDGFKMLKMRTDGSNLTVVCNDEANYINVIDDWIYYSNSHDKGKIYKIRTDGSSRIKICDDDADCINVVGDWIYYIVKEETNEHLVDVIYKIRIDGSDKTRIYGCGLTEYINVSGDWIYFGLIDGLYKIRTDGSSITKICDDYPWFINVVDNWIYYLNMNEYKSYRIHTDGSKRQLVD